MTTFLTGRWTALGAAAPGSLSDARLQVHHAVQVAVSATISYLAPRPDDSHTALEWVAPLRALMTETMPAERALRVGVRPAKLTLLAVHPEANSIDTFALDGRTVNEAFRWLAGAVRAAGLDPETLTTRKHYEIPDHSVVRGGRFALAPGSAFAELERYWSNAATLLDELAQATEGASAVRCWPHHFDIATLITLPAPASSPARTIGVGHSPGDEWYGEPYWYVGPNPRPPVHDLPPLDGGGHWHTRGWVGAVLPASAYVSGSAADQARQVAAFVAAAVSASRRLLGG